MVTITDTEKIKTTNDLTVPFLMKVNRRYYLAIMDSHYKYTLIDIELGAVMKENKDLDDLFDYLDCPRAEVLIYQDFTVQVRGGEHIQ